jgi:hypothetical protein
MSCPTRSTSALRADLSVLALTLVFLGIACGPTPNRKRRDASPISDTGGEGGFDDTGGIGGFGTGGFGGFGTGGAGTGGTGTGGSGLGSGGSGTGGKLDAGPGDAAVDAALQPDSAPDLPGTVTPDAGVDAAADVAVPADLAPDLARDLAPDVAADLANDATLEQTGLVGYWRFDEASGTSASDSSMSANTGTLLNGAAFSSAAHFPNADFANSGGVTLDGVNDYVSFGATNIPGSTAAQTVSLWVNYSSTAGTHNFITLTNPTALCGLQIGLRGGDLRAWKWGGVTLVTKTSPPASGWHNIIYTFDGSNHTLIVDGVTAANSNTLQASCAVTDVQVGAVETSKELFQGSVDDLRIYNRVITAAEIALIAAGADPTLGRKLDAGVDTSPDGPTIDLTTNLAGYWKLDEGTGTTTADSSGNGNVGTIAGNPTWPTGFPAAQFTNPHALALDGTDDQVQVGVTNFAALDQPRSVSLWFNYATAPAAGNRTYFSVTNRAANTAMGAGFQMGTRGTNLAVWAIGGFVYLTVPAPAVGWHHMVYTFDGTTHLLYLDGAQVVTSTGMSPLAQNVPAAESLIGNYLNGNERFTGRIDDVRIWKNRALGQAEVTALFSGQ